MGLSMETTAHSSRHVVGRTISKSVRKHKKKYRRQRACRRSAAKSRKSIREKHAKCLHGSHVGKKTTINEAVLKKSCETMIVHHLKTYSFVRGGGMVASALLPLLLVVLSASGREWSCAPTSLLPPSPSLPPCRCSSS